MGNKEKKNRHRRGQRIGSWPRKDASTYIGCPKSLLGFFYKMLRKNSNKIFGQPTI